MKQNKIEIQDMKIRFNSELQIHRDYLAVFLRYFKQKRKFNVAFFDRNYMKFFPTVILDSLGILFDNLKYKKKIKKTRKVQSFFGFIQETQKNGSCTRHLQVSVGLYFNFSLLRNWDSYSTSSYRTSEDFRLNSFFLNLMTAATKKEQDLLHSTKGHDFAFKELDDEFFFNKKAKITIEDSVTPILQLYTKKKKKLIRSKREHQFKYNIKYLSCFLSNQPSSSIFLLLISLSSRYLATIKNLFGNYSESKSLSLFKHYGGMINFVFKPSHIINIQYKTLTFIYKNYYSLLKRYINYVTTNNIKRTKAQKKIKGYRTSIRSVLRLYKKKKSQRKKYRSTVVHLKRKLIFSFLKQSYVGDYFKKLPRKLFRRLRKTTRKPVRRFTSKNNTIKKFKPAQLYSTLLPVAFSGVGVNPIDIFFDSNLSISSKVIGITTSFQRRLLQTVQKVMFYMHLARTNENVINTTIFNRKTIKDKMNLLHLEKLSFSDTIRNVLSTRSNNIHPFYKNINYFIIFDFWRKLKKTNPSINMQHLFPLNIHKFFLNTIQMVGNFDNRKKYPNLFKSWSLRFFRKVYPNYKIVIRPYRQLRGSVQLNVLTEHNYNLFSSWPGLVFKKPEEIVGDHQEHKYIYLRFLKRKTAKLDYNAKLLSARHISNFLYTLLKKRPGTIEVVMRRPIDSMSKTLVDAVVPLYFWKKRFYFKGIKKIERFKKKTKIQLDTYPNIIIYNSIYYLKTQFKSKLFKYLFQNFAFKLKKARAALLMQTTLCDSKFNSKTYLSVILNLKLEVYHLLLTFIFLFRVFKKNINIFNLVKKHLKIKNHGMKIIQLKKFLVVSKIKKTTRNFFLANLRVFKKKQLNVKNFNIHVDESNFQNFRKFVKLSKSTFSKLGPFVLTKRICVIPEVSHGSYEKPRKARRV